MSTHAAECVSTRCYWALLGAIACCCFHGNKLALMLILRCASSITAVSSDIDAYYYVYYCELKPGAKSPSLGWRLVLGRTRAARP